MKLDKVKMNRKKIPKYVMNGRLKEQRKRERSRKRFLANIE